MVFGEFENGMNHAKCHLKSHLYGSWLGANKAGGGKAADVCGWVNESIIELGMAGWARSSSDLEAPRVHAVAD